MLIKYSEVSYVLCLLLCIWVSSATVRLAQAADPTRGTKQLIQDSRQHFLSSYADWLSSSGNENATWLKNYLIGLDVGISSSQSAAITPVTATELENRRLGIRRLIGMSKLDHVFGAETGYVEDKKLIPILVAALQDEDEVIRELALKTLTWETRNADLLPFGAAIKTALTSTKTESTLFLLAKLPLTSTESGEILAQSNVAREIRARLGDRSAEGKMIATFAAENDYSRKRNLAQQLGYVGSEAATRALVDALRSPVSINGVYDDRSIRCDVLLALGLIYQDERLFTTDARLLSSNSEESFERYRGLASYIADVDAWVRKNFGHPAWGEQSVWFKRWRHIPIVSPPQ